MECFVDAGALPEYHYSEDDQQDHGPALASFGLAADPLVSFVLGPSTEEQPTTAADNHWTWNGSRRKW